MSLPGSLETSRQYRRGAVMGLTVAEAFMLLAFILMMLLVLWRFESEEEIRAIEHAAGIAPGANRGARSARPGC